MTPIYRIIDITNLASICEHDGIWCKSSVETLGIKYTNIAHTNIMDKRAKIKVQRRYPPIRQVAKGGVLADYVPFYFAPRSPMLCSISHGKVEGYPQGQNGVIHFVSSAEEVKNKGLDFAFTDGHAIMTLSEFYDDLEDLHHIDWEIMNARFWGDTIEDNDRSRRREAEFLVRRFFPWTLVSEISVISNSIAEEVRTIIKESEHQPIVTIRPGWYYSIGE